MDLRIVVAVAIGAALGGVGRLLVTQSISGIVAAQYVQYATLSINVTGSFLIGVVIEYAQTTAAFPTIARYFLATGILGGYTTFSTFSYESYLLLNDGRLAEAAMYICGSVVLGILAAFAGIAAVRFGLR